MNILFPIISFPYASRILLPDGIGRVNFANSIIEYFIMFAVLGINLYAAREAARVRDDKDKLNKLSREILSINLISTIISCTMLVIAILVIPKLSSYRILLLICATKVLFTTLGMEWLYNAEEEYGYVTIRQTIFQVISLAALFTLVKSQDDYLIYAGITSSSKYESNLRKHNRNVFYIFFKPIDYYATAERKVFAYCTNYFSNKQYYTECNFNSPYGSFWSCNCHNNC